jgi:hypothetical protein
MDPIEVVKWASVNNVAFAHFQDLEGGRNPCHRVFVKRELSVSREVLVRKDKFFQIPTILQSLESLNFISLHV